MELRHRALGELSGHDAGRVLLAETYRDVTGQEIPDILIADRGKPYFKDSPLHFSISHTKHHVFCALSERPIGIDAEEMDRKIDLRLAEKILSPAEQLRYHAALDKRAALLKLWVLKEAAAKLAGDGIRGYPNQTDFDPNDPRVREIAGCFVAMLEE